jgi:hypothetical protein
MTHISAARGAAIKSKTGFEMPVREPVSTPMIILLALLILLATLPTVISLK